jgi:hypothetical protein
VSDARRRIREAVEELFGLEPWLGQGTVERWQLTIRTSEGWAEVTGDANDAGLGLMGVIDFENERDEAIAAIKAAGRQ